MFKNLLFAIAVFAVLPIDASAQVEVNHADLAALDGVKGIGPRISGAILAERRRRGDFKDWEDLQRRVAGIGSRRAVALSESGLTVNGHGAPDRYSPRGRNR